MSNYLKTEEVLKDLDIEIFELFNLCKEGKLQAYNEYCQRVVDPDLCKKEKEFAFNRILMRVHDDLMMEHSLSNKPGVYYANITEEEIERRARERYNAQPEYPIIPENCVEFNFSLPACLSKDQIPQGLQRILNRKFKDAEAFIFKKSDIEKLKIERGPEAVCGSASNNNIGAKKRKAPRIRINELHDVIWNAYLALTKKHSREPTSGEVWLELERDYDKDREYDTFKRSKKEQSIGEILKATKIN